MADFKHSQVSPRDSRVFHYEHTKRDKICPFFDPTTLLAPRAHLIDFVNLREALGKTCWTSVMEKNGYVSSAFRIVTIRTHDTK